MCSDKGKVRDILWTGNGNGNEDDGGGTNLMVMEVTINSKMTIIMTT